MKVSNVVHAVDLHAGGEHGRVIVGGVLDVPGNSMFEKMEYLANEADELRLRMLREPRGYPAANCNLILPPTVDEADAGFVIMEQVEYPPMSGTNTICVVTTLIETGMVQSTEPSTRLVLETPRRSGHRRCRSTQWQSRKCQFRKRAGIRVSSRSDHRGADVG